MRVNLENKLSTFEKKLISNGSLRKGSHVGQCAPVTPVKKFGENDFEKLWVY